MKNSQMPQKNLHRPQKSRVGSSFSIGFQDRQHFFCGGGGGGGLEMCWILLRNSFEILMNIFFALHFF